MADSGAIASQIAFELNIPHSEELAKAVVEMISTAKEEESLLLRTGGVLANDLAWTHLASFDSEALRHHVQ